MRLPVHCCCNPSVRLGFLEVDNPREGQVLTFALLEPMSAHWKELPIPMQRVRLEVANLHRFGDVPMLAVKSNHVPYEDLLRIRQFEGIK